MKTWLNKTTQLLRLKFARSNNQDIISFAICLLIATSLWFLNALNKEYTINLSYPIRYINMPKDKLLRNTPPDHFILKVQGGGFSILRHKMSMSFTPLVLNCESLFSKKYHADSAMNIRISTQSLEDKITQQISSELRILDISPDSLSFDLDQLKMKRVKVKSDITYSLAKQHFISDTIRFTPDSIDVFGPSAVLDTLQAIYTEKQHYDKLNQTIRRNISIQQIKNFQCTPKRVVMNVPVEEFTEKVIEVPIEIINAPSDLNIKLFPDKAKVSFLVSLSNFSTMSGRDFKLIVDYSKLNKQTNLLSVEAFRKPNYVYSLKTSPTHVEYLILNTHKHD
ncbi:MAG: hypothetical protein ACK5JS_02930 [Mangrovibacterium sp.]